MCLIFIYLKMNVCKWCLKYVKKINKSLIRCINMKTDIIHSISLIKSSKNKLKIMESLHEDIKIPSEIANETGIRLNHVSNLLKDLKDDGLVKCLNEESKKGRIYQLTKKGNTVFDIVNK